MLVYGAEMPARPRRTALLCACALSLGARAAPTTSVPNPFWVVLEGLYAAPGGDPSRGPGVGLRLGYRVSDQVSTAIGFETLLARGGPVTGISAGFEAMLDSTPIAPFLELSLVRADPFERAGFSLAQRSGFGADWKLSPACSLGAVVRYFMVLDAAANVSATGLSGLELGVRLVLFPGAF